MIRHGVASRAPPLLALEFPHPGTRPGTRPGASRLSPRGRKRGSGVPSTRTRDRDVAFTADAAPGSTEMSFACTVTCISYQSRFIVN